MNKITLNQWDEMNRALFLFKTGHEVVQQDVKTLGMAGEDFLDAIDSGVVAARILKILGLSVNSLKEEQGGLLSSGSQTNEEK